MDNSNRYLLIDKKKSEQLQNNQSFHHQQPQQLQYTNYSRNAREEYSNQDDSVGSPRNPSVANEGYYYSNGYHPNGLGAPGSSSAGYQYPNHSQQQQQHLGLPQEDVSRQRKITKDNFYNVLQSLSDQMGQMDQLISNIRQTSSTNQLVKQSQARNFDQRSPLHGASSFADRSLWEDNANPKVNHLSTVDNPSYRAQNPRLSGNNTKRSIQNLPSSTRNFAQHYSGGNAALNNSFSIAQMSMHANQHPDLLTPDQMFDNPHQRYALNTQLTPEKNSRLILPKIKQSFVGPDLQTDKSQFRLENPRLAYNQRYHSNQSKPRKKGGPGLELYQEQHFRKIYGVFAHSDGRRRALSYNQKIGRPSNNPMSFKHKLQRERAEYSVNQLIAKKPSHLRQMSEYSMDLGGSPVKPQSYEQKLFMQQYQDVLDPRPNHHSRNALLQRIQDPPQQMRLNQYNFPPGLGPSKYYLDFEKTVQQQSRETLTMLANVFQESQNYSRDELMGKLSEFKKNYLMIAEVHDLQLRETRNKYSMFKTFDLPDDIPDNSIIRNY